MKHFWDANKKEVWILSGHSRRLRKLYKELAQLDAEIETIRQRRFVPDHAPSDLVARKNALRPVEEARWVLLQRIDKQQNE